MKWNKYIAGAAGIFLVLSWTFLLPVRAKEDPAQPKDLYARSAVLLDADSGRVLFGKEETAIRPMASTTKIMTCILALEEMEEDQTGRVSEEAAGQPKVRLGVEEGETYRLQDLLYALMLESYNDSAVVIAESLAGSVEAFVEKMNDRAEELGLRDTHFVTPNGLDGADKDGVHATTARELALLMRYCIRESPKKEEFLAITQTKEYTFTDVSGKRTFSCHNHNAFLDMMEGALTGKTGFTADAGYCYVGELRRDERTFIVALLGCGWPGHKNYKWEDTRKLMEYGLAAYEYREIGPEDAADGAGNKKTVDGGPFLEIPVRNGVDPEHPYARETVVRAEVEDSTPVRILMREDEEAKFQTEVPDAVEAPVKKGARVGKIGCVLNGEEVAQYTLTAAEQIEEYDFKRGYAVLFQTFLL